MLHALHVIGPSGQNSERLWVVAITAKANIESAFHLLVVHPEDFCLLGFESEGTF